MRLVKGDQKCASRSGVGNHEPDKVQESTENRNSDNAQASSDYQATLNTRHIKKW